jgi:Ca2+-binding RTX toxin-like protein
MVASCVGTFGKQTTLNLGAGLDSATVDSSVPSSGKVTVNGDADGTNVYASSAAAAIAVNSALGNIFQTGSGPDVLVLGGPGFQAEISTGGSADSLTFTTDLPKATYDPETEDAPYSFGKPYLNEDWPVYVSTDAGGDYVDGSASSGAFWYEAAEGCDLILGGAGSDWFNGGGSGTEDDTVVAGAGDDTIYSYPTNAGDDMFYGQAGNDRLFVWNNDAEEMFDGGTGTDIISYQSGASSGSPSVSLDGTRNDGLLGNDIWTSTVERVVGAISNTGQTMIGNADANLFSGGIGADTLIGGAGTDTLNSQGGNDSVDSYDGQPDTVDCGSGTGDSANVDSVDTVSNCETVTPH